VSVTPQLSVHTGGAGNTILHNSQLHPAVGGMAGNGAYSIVHRMNIILSVSFAVCIGPGIGIISLRTLHFLSLQVLSESVLLRSYP
jgi:hypothetical protein